MVNTLITQLKKPAVLLQLNQRLAALVSLLLTVACVYVLVQVIWLFIPQEEQQPVSVLHKSLPASKSQSQQNSFRKLTAANIFGVIERVVVQKQSKAPETKLNLILKGVLAAIPMKQASAIIAQGKSGKEDIYGVGDKIQGNVIIKEIHPAYVVLERKGVAEILKLQKVDGLANVESALKSATSPDISAELTKIRDKLIYDPVSLGDDIRPVAVMENGKQLGYRLQSQKNWQLLSRLGIQGTDVIVEVNGIKLNNAQNGLQTLRFIRNAKNFNLVVKRNGENVPVKIALE